MKEKYIECLVLTVIYLLSLGIHWLLSGWLFSNFNNNLNWTQLEIFYFLAWMSTMGFMLLFCLTLVRPNEKPDELDGE